MSAFSRHKGLILVFVILSLLSFGVYFTKTPGRLLTLPERWFRDTVAVIEKPVLRVSHFFRTIYDRVTSLSSLESENTRLRDRVAFLSSKVRVFEEERQEKHRLEALLGMRADAGYSTIAARVIARDPARWISSLTIDRGSDDGIESDMAVLAPGGLVGRITAVSQRTASVLLVLDSRSAVSALIRRSRDIVIAEGARDKPGHLTVKPLNARLLGDSEEWTSQVKIRVGDVVISSGLGGVFPKGLVLGRVISIGQGRYGVSKSAVVKPFVDFNRLEEVLVVTHNIDMENSHSFEEPSGSGGAESR